MHFLPSFASHKRDFSLRFPRRECYYTHANPFPRHVSLDHAHARCIVRERANERASEGEGEMPSETGGRGDAAWPRPILYIHKVTDGENAKRA